MYNRSSYNRMPYNRSAEASGNITGSAVIHVAASGRANINCISSGAPAQIRLKTGPAQASRTAYVMGEPAIVRLVTPMAIGQRNASAQGVPTAIRVITSAAVAELLGLETLSFSAINLPPGSELIIDTGEMTVYLDGENAMRYLDDDSVFFALLSGENYLLAESTDAGSADLYILWKDRWL